MKRYLGTAIEVAFVAVAVQAFAADEQQTPPATTPQSGNFSAQDLEKIHSAPAKKKARKTEEGASAQAGETTTSEKDLEKIHSAPAKKQTAPPATQTGTGSGSSNYSERDLEKIHSAPARKEAKPPDTEINMPEGTKKEPEPQSDTK